MLNNQHPQHFEKQILSLGKSFTSSPKPPTDPAIDDQIRNVKENEVQEIIA